MFLATHKHTCFSMLAYHYTERIWYPYIDHSVCLSKSLSLQVVSLARQFGLLQNALKFDLLQLLCVILTSDHLVCLMLELLIMLIANLCSWFYNSLETCLFAIWGCNGRLFYCSSKNKLVLHILFSSNFLGMNLAIRFMLTTVFSKNGRAKISLEILHYMLCYNTFFNIFLYNVLWPTSPRTGTKL